MLIENNTLERIDLEDIIDGVFTAPDDVLYVGDDLECHSVYNVVKIVLPNVVEIGNDFLFANNTLKYLEIPKVVKIGDCFLYLNRTISDLEMPKVESLGECFLYNNIIIESIDMPNIKEIGFNFLAYNCKFKYTPGIIKALKGYLYIGRMIVDKTEYLRELKIKKLLC